jgi:hypothetical protein
MIVRREILYRCDICGKEGTEDFIFHEFPFGYGYNSWDHEFHLCSKGCDVVLLNYSPKERRKLEKELRLKTFIRTQS